MIFIPVFVSGKNLASTQSLEVLQKNTLCFVENRGLLKDQFGNARNDINFKVNGGGGLSIFIGNGALHYQFSRSIGSRHLERTPKPDPFNINNCKEQDSIEIDRVDVELVDANTRAPIITADKQNYKEYYYLPWMIRNQVSSAYQRVTYKDIYPNIDWVLYIKDDKLEYDFIVHDGADPGKIKIRYNGIRSLNKEGNSITAVGPLGTITESGLRSYLLANKESVVSSFKVDGNIVGFNVSKYTGTLVIDPTLDWATYYGGYGAYGTGVACGVLGNVYITGYTNSPYYIATTGAYQTVFKGADDAYIAKLDSTGAMLWASYYGGYAMEEVNGITVDSAEYIYITGQTNSIESISTPGAFKLIWLLGVGKTVF